MKSRVALFVMVGVLTGALALVAGCQEESAPDQIGNQYAADYQAKAQELEPMVGFFEGKAHLDEMDQDFDCQVTLSVPPMTEPSTLPQDPSETVPIARLQGSITFPALASLPLEDYPGFLPLFKPLDGLPGVTVMNGDYNPRVMPPVTLPYLAVDGKTIFGTFDGTIQGDEFKGTWVTMNYGNVGSFDLHRISTTPAVQPNGEDNP